MYWKALFFTTEPEIKAQDRDTLLLRAPPGCDRSCQEASEQLGVEASGTSQCVPACGKGSPAQGSPRATTTYLCPKSHPHRQG